MTVKSAISALFAVLFSSVSLAEAEKSDSEVWNEGVTFYEKGDVTNALRVLRPLMLSRTHGARAAEVVAAIAHSRGEREEAAAAAQIALRASPSDGKANRNFTRAIDGLAEERENKRIDALLKAAEGKDPAAMLRGAVYESRSLVSEAASYRTNRAEKAVALSDALSRRASVIADVWYPVREAIARSVTNETQAATIVAQIDQATEKTKRAAKEFSDLSDGAYSSISDAEHDFTRFFKLTVLPPAAADEALLSQSNAYLDVETVNGRAWQSDALDYTRAFRANFPAWAREREARAQSDTNLPPFTAEAQAKISALATEVEKIQLECVEKNLPPMQLRACSILEEIRSLLPKDNSGGGGGGQGGGAGGENKRNDEKPDNEKKDGDKNGESDERQGEQEESPPEEEEKQGAGEQEEESREDKEIEALFRKAQERNDEHEAEKKARMRKSPLPPNERDW